jgi:hypothetical protein
MLKGDQVCAPQIRRISMVDREKYGGVPTHSTQTQMLTKRPPVSEMSRNGDRMKTISQDSKSNDA